LRIDVDCYALTISLCFSGRPSVPVAPLTTTITEPPDRPPIPPDPLPTPLVPIPKPAEPFKPEETKAFLDKPFLSQPKPISHSPKISPSSIPNPSPSVATTKHLEPGYPNYNSYLYSIPGYSAFQPVSYPGVVQPNKTPIQNETNDFVPFPKVIPIDISDDKLSGEAKTATEVPPNQIHIDLPKTQTDFEEHFTSEIIPANSVADSNHKTECKMSITSLAQGSGATVTIPSHIPNKDVKMKTSERFSLKTSIPISKIDLKCVNNPTDSHLQSAMSKKLPALLPANPPFQAPKLEAPPRVEIQSNIVIKTAQEAETKDVKPNPPPPHNTNSISTLINAAEAINKTETQFRKPEIKSDASNEVKETNSNFPPPTSNALTRPIFNPINIDSNKTNFSNKPPESSFNEQKNQILFIQNKNTSNPKMLLTIQQQNPQVLLQRTNFDSKNLQAPSRLSSQKKCKEEVVNDNGTSSKVVALKRLHQENCDENDFENLITENQIYGNKIVVKEKSQGTLQEQDIKNKTKLEKSVQNETKNMVLQPNFLYLSNVQFPANLMMIKNTKVAQTNDANKNTKVAVNENKVTDVSTTTNNTETNVTVKNTKPPNGTNKEIQVLKSSNNVLQTISNKTNKSDLVFQTGNQKVIVSPQIVYQVPMIVDSDNKANQPYINMDYSKIVGQNKKEYPKQFEQTKSNDKLFIACPYQMDAKLQPKIVITNIRPKIPKVEEGTVEISSLDIYEKRRRLRRLKYLSNREPKDQKTEVKKTQEKGDTRKNIITPEKMTAEIFKEFASTKITLEDAVSESESEYGEDELKEYNAIIKEFEEKIKTEDERGKVEFMSGLRLATHEIYKGN
jgi:hypothetical protein